MFEGIKDKIGDIKDFFQQKGDDIFGVERKIAELENDRLLPQKVFETLEDLKDNDDIAKNNREAMEKKLKETIRDRENCRKEIKNKEDEINSNFGFFQKLRYNFLPLPFAFTRKGRAYHDLKKELTILNMYLKFYIRCTKEDYNIFIEAVENRKERRRALNEYKRIVFNKAKYYKDEFKFIKEYNKLKDIDNTKLENILGPQCKNNLKNYKKIIVENWFDMEFPKYFDAKQLTKILTKIRKNDNISLEEKEEMKRIILDIDDKQQQDKKDSQDKKTKKDLKQDIQPPVDYQKYQLDRRAIEVLSYKYNEKSNTNLTPEEFLVVIGLSYKTNLNMKDILNRVDRIKGYNNNTGRKALGKLAAQGAEVFSKMLNDDTIGNGFESYLELYKKAKDTIDRNTLTKDDGQRTN